MKINWNNKYLTIAIYALLVITGGILIYNFLDGYSGYKNIGGAIKNIFIPIIYGIVIAYILSPIEKFFEYTLLPKFFKKKREKLARYLSITISYLLFVLGTFAILYVAIPQLVESIDKIIATAPRYFNNVQNWLNDFFKTDTGKLLAKNFDLSSVDIQGLLDRFETMISSSFSAVKTTLSAFMTVLVNLFLGIVISVYLLSDRELYFRQITKVLYAFGNKNKIDSFCDSCKNFKDIFNNFMYSKIIGCLIVGLICYIGVLIMGVNNALLISVIVGVTNFIPYFGPIIGSIPGFLLIFFDAEKGVNPTMAFVFLLFIIVLQQVEGNILSPKIQGKIVGISSFWVLISVIVFGELFGVLGMLLSVPFFAVMISAFKLHVQKRLDRKFPKNSEE